MSDISEQQMDELIAAMNKSAGSLGKIADNYATGRTGPLAKEAKAQSNAARQAQMLDTKATKEHSSAVTNTTKAIKEYGAKISSLFSFEKIRESTVAYGKELTKTYRDLSNYGQSFSGSLFKMGQMAARAGLPLEQFAEAVRHNSVVVNQLGVQRFADLSKRVRQLTQQAGMYGLTVEQLNQFGLDMMETQRLAGKNLSSVSGEAMARRIQGFALNVTAVSDALGAQREVVMRLTQESLRSEAAASAARLNAMKGLDAYNDAMMDAVAALAAQPGEAGKQLSKGLADAFGSINGSLFTDLGRDFISVGQQGAMRLIDQANERIARGEDSQLVAMETVAKLSSELRSPQALESLRLLAQTSGPAADSARRVLGIANDLKEYTLQNVEQKKKEREQADAMSSFMLSWGNTVATLKGALIDGFLTPFMTMDKIDPQKVEAFWKQINDMGPVLKDFAARFGELLTTFLTPANLKLAGDTLITVVQLAASTTKVVGGIIGQIANVFKIFHDGMKMLFGEKVAGAATALAAFTAWFGGKALLNAVMGFFARTISGNLVNVNGRVVNVNGGGGAGLGDFLDGDIGGGEGKGKKGRRGGNQRARRLRARGFKRGLRGAALEGFVEEGVRKSGRLGRMVSRIPGAKAVGAIGGRLTGVGRAMSAPLKAVGKFGGPVTAALVAGLTIADAANTIKDINEQVAAGKMTPQEARKALGKMAGATTGTLAGSVIGGIVGQALIPIPGVGAAIGAAAGGALGNWAGGKVGGFIANVTAPKAPPKPASPSVPQSRAGAAQPRTVATQPRVLDDRIVAQMRTDAILGDKAAAEQLRKIEESIRNQTAILVSQQTKNTQAVKETTNTIRSTGGFAGT
jgi:hypothetical protein